MNTFETGMHKLLVAQLAELYFCENQLIGALAKMAKATTEPALRDLFLAHLGETRHHVERLEEAFAKLGVRPEAHVCRTLDGMMEDARWQMLQLKGDHLLDHWLVGAAQRTELFEVASYRNAARLARTAGHEEVARLCEQTLTEEEHAYELLGNVLSMPAEHAGNGRPRQ